MPLELTEQQRQAVQQQRPEPVEVIDPVSSQTYVLIARPEYERLRALSAGGCPKPPDEPGVPPGIRRSQEAFWRNLPQLLAQRKLRGAWVCYHGDERVGTGNHEALIRECLRRGISDDAYYLARVRPRSLPPWEPEDIEPLGDHHLADDPATA